MTELHAFGFGFIIGGACVGIAWGFWGKIRTWLGNEETKIKNKL